MMNHLRSSKGDRELVNLNNLLVENINLTYHSYRSIHPNFQVHLDHNYPAKEVLVPAHSSDLARALVNILNNAFYAIDHKRQTAPASYKPTVTVKTSHNHRFVLVTITDSC